MILTHLQISVEQPFFVPVSLRLVIAVAINAFVLHEFLGEVFR